MYISGFFQSQIQKKTPEYSTSLFKNCLGIYIFVALDVNECTTKSYSCDANAVCQNTKGSYKCTCKAGYVGDGKKCSGK